MSCYNHAQKLRFCLILLEDTISTHLDIGTTFWMCAKPRNTDESRIFFRDIIFGFGPRLNPGLGVVLGAGAER